MVEKKKGFIKVKGEKDDAVEKEGVFIPIEKRAPHRPEYLHMSKADVIKAESKRLDNNKKMEAYKKKLEEEGEEQEAPAEQPEESAVMEKAKKGKSKKI